MAKALRLLSIVAILLLGLGQAANCQNAQTELLNRAQREYLDQVRPVIQQYCGDCHWGDHTEGELNFESYRELDELLSITDQWKQAIIRINDNEMPPEGSDPLPAEQKRRLVEWIDQLVNNLDCTDISPGQPVIRRLNRTEYRNTIRDLTGVDFHPAQSFPGDDVGHGFDNMGETLSLPPILLEKYLDAAEKIVEQAIVDYDQPVLDQQWNGAQFKLTRRRAGRPVRQLLAMTSNSGAEQHFELPHRSRVQLTISAFQTKGGDDDARMSVYLDGKKRKTFKVAAEQEDPGTYHTEFSVSAGKHKLTLTFDNDFYTPAAEDTPAVDRNLFIQQVAITANRRPPKNPNRKIIFEDPPTNDTERDAFAGNVLRRFASRAFRRRATDAEVDRLYSLYQSARAEGDSFAEAIRLAVKATLVSPRFLFRVEGPLVPGRQRDLDAYELASATSYFLWSTMPDNELFRLAISGELNDADVYRGQVARMLNDPRANSLVENFASQWLQLRALPDFEPDPSLFPGVNDELRALMIRETKLFVGDVFRQDKSVLSLLDSNQTFLNEQLAAHYGLPGVSGNQFRAVELPGQRGGGLLTQASVLTLTSNPTRTSPVKRGKWIMENLLGDEPPPPDPSVMQLEDQPELTGTLRERMEQHRRDPACASCHKTMDALGFALENFDAVGRWRETDEELPINSTGTLPDGTSFTGARQLQELLRTDMREQFVRCFSEKMLIYAIGRGLQYYDQCAVDRIMERLEQNDYRFSELIIAVTESKPFRSRRGPKGNAKP